MQKSLFPILANVSNYTKLFFPQRRKDISLSPQHASFIIILPLPLTEAAVLSQKLISHCLDREQQRICKACQLLNKKFSTRGIPAPPEMVIPRRRFSSDGQAGKLPRALTMTMSHIWCLHPCAEQYVHQSLSYGTVLLLRVLPQPLEGQ